MNTSMIDKLAEFCGLADKGYRRDREGDWLDENNFVWNPFKSDSDCRVVLEECRQRGLFVNFQNAMFDDWLSTDSIDADRAYKFFVFSWAMRNGVAGTSRVRGNGFQIAVRFTPGGGSPTVRFRSATESIPAWHDRLRNVVILRRDSFQLLPRFDDLPGLAIYADPPYHPSSRSGYAAAGATSRYEHEFSHDNPLFGDDHERLRDALAAFKKARVVVSYYDCERIRSLYSGWTIVECSRQKNLHAQNGRGARPKEAPEILIINGPSYTEANQ